jgi:hypothetical protein
MVCQWFGLKTTGTVSPGLTSKLMAMVFLVWLQNQGSQFLSLALKTGSCDLVIWVSKSPQPFLDLSLKTKQALVCRLRHKTNGRTTAWDTHRDVAAYFTWKHVGLGFFSLPQNWWRRDGGWCMWHHREGCVRIKLKMNRSMRRAVSDSATLALPFSLY